jgi:hypothetical protein
VTEPLKALRLRPAPPRRAKREPALWPLTLALLVALAVVCVAVDNARSPGLDPAVFVNAALVVIGGVLALSSWRGRAGWTALLALPLLPLWIAFSAADIGRFDGSGDRRVEITSPPDTGAVDVELGYGDLHVVVTEHALSTDSPLRLTAGVTAGSATITVPETARVVLRSHGGLGIVEVDNASGPWSSDAAVLVDHRRGRVYGPVRHECYTETLTPAQMAASYRDWRRAYDRVGAVPDFSQAGAETRDAADQFFREYFSLPPMPVESDGRLTWNYSWSDTGEPCDPAAPPVVETGTIEIDATIGLGRIHIVRAS